MVPHRPGLRRIKPERRRGTAISEGLPVNARALREEVRRKYRDVAVNPHGVYHFHTGCKLACRLGYDEALVARMPDSAVEAFAGVGNPFSLAAVRTGERVVDIGSGGGFDCFIAAGEVGAEGHVLGIPPPRTTLRGAAGSG